MELLFEQKVTGKITRLVLRPDEELDSFALQMISHNEIACLAPLEAVWYDNENYLQYDITGLTPLSSKLSSVLKKGEVLQLLGSMVSSFEEIDAYMLQENNLYLNMNYVYVDEKDNCVLLYLPFMADCGMNQIEFLRQTVEGIMPNFEEKDPYLFHILNAFSRGAVRQLADLKEVLQRNSGDKEPLEAEVKALEAQMPEPQSLKRQNPEKQGLKKQSPEKQGREENKPVQAPGASFAIPGKSEGFSMNIPGKSEGFSVNIPGKSEGFSMNIPGKAENVPAKKAGKAESRLEKKAGKAENVSAKKAEKSSSSQGETPEKKKRFFGKKEKKPLQEAGNVISAPPAENKIENSKDDGMYEGYVQTVMVQRAGEEAADSEMTLCITQGAEVQLIREKTGERLPVARSGAVIGSGSTADCRILGNKAVSRAHAVLRIQDGICSITDNNSSNGTWVDGVRLIPGNAREVADNARIRLADEDFILSIQ